MKYCLLDHAWDNVEANPRFIIVESIPGLKNVRIRGTFETCLSSAKTYCEAWKANYAVGCERQKLSAPRPEA